ncbi:MAG TPA: hypothetical protein VME46_11030 [Acidimicrobiales bacterium]|nr:hypothetical protein [Acidimicrobiales bacterium]
MSDLAPRQAITDQREPADRIDPADSAEPIENIDSTDPTLPTDSTDPTEPTDRKDPLEQIESKEPSDQSDHRELRASVRMGTSCPLLAPTVDHLPWTEGGRCHGWPALAQTRVPCLQLQLARAGSDLIHKGNACP